MALFGSIAAWIIQLIEIHLYHNEINVESPVGLFEDEFIRTIIHVLPTLLIAELSWKYLKTTTQQTRQKISWANPHKEKNL